MNAPITKLVETAKSGSLLPNLRHDVPASLVVFLVALPLSLGIAIASGAPLAAGLIAAVVGGVVAGSLGGSSVQVSGPAAGLTVVVAGLIDDLGFPMLCLMTIGAGALQIAFGLSRMARAALAIAPVVVHAMLAGIGITIVLQQVHVLMGGSSHSSAWQNLVALPNGILHHELDEVITGGTVIAASRGAADGAATMADRGGTAPSGNGAVAVAVPQRPHAIPSPRKRSGAKP